MSNACQAKPVTRSQMGIVEPAQSMKAFSPALCSCRITTCSPRSWKPFGYPANTKLPVIEHRLRERRRNLIVNALKYTAKAVQFISQQAALRIPDILVFRVADA